MGYTPLTLQEVARRIRDALMDPEQGEADAWLPIREFLDDFRAAAPEVRQAMIAPGRSPPGIPASTPIWRPWPNIWPSVTA